MQLALALVGLATLGGGVVLYAMLVMIFLAIEYANVAKGGQRFQHMDDAGRMARKWMLLVLVAGFAAGRMAKRSEFQLASAPPGAALVLAGIGGGGGLRVLAQGLRRDLEQQRVLSRGGIEVTAWLIALGIACAVLWWVWPPLTRGSAV